MKRTRFGVWVIAAAGLGLLLVLLWWFWSADSDVAEVTGVVTLDGKPLEQVEVRFLPDPEKGTSGPMSSCYTDAAGRYVLRCERLHRDGAVAGVHRVVFFDTTTLLESPTDGADSWNQVPQVSRVPRRYMDVSLTPFKDTELKSGKQEMNFDLKSK